MLVFMVFTALSGLFSLECRGSVPMFRSACEGFGGLNPQTLNP